MRRGRPRENTLIEGLYWEDLREDLRGSRCSGLGRVGGNREWEMGMIAGVNGTAGESEGLLDGYRWWTQGIADGIQMSQMERERNAG